MRILEYVYMKGVRASDLGIDRTYFYKLRAGKYPVTDQVLEKVLGFSVRRSSGGSLPLECWMPSRARVRL